MCHPQIFSRKGGLWCCINGLVFIFFHIQVCHNETYRRSHGSTLLLLKNLPWKAKYVLVRQYSSSLVMFFTDKDVLLWSSGSSSSNFLMVFMAGLMGTEVNSALTSKETMH